MSVSTTISSVSYTGDGSTVNFAVTFPFKGEASASEITVVERTIATGAEVTKSYTTHYTVTGGGGATGTVIAGSAPASTVQWHIRRNTTATQTSDYVTNDPFAADTVEGDFDRLMMLQQEQAGDITQAFKFPDTYTGGASTVMPEPVASASLLWNAAGDALENSTSSAAQYLGGNGTVLLPFYSFTSDPNTGFYRIGADNIGLSLGGTKRVDFAAATVGFSAQVTATGFTGTLDGILGSGTPAAATVTGLTSGGAIVSDTDSTDDLGTTSVRWRKLWVDDIQTTADAAISGNLVVTGNLTINGTTVTNDATNTEIKDPLIEINSGAGSNANDLGTIAERGSTGPNVFWGWDESSDRFVAGLTTAIGTSTGNISFSAMAEAEFGNVVATGATFSGTSSNLGTVTTVDINGGTLDGAVIGGASSAAITGTTIKGDTSLELATGATVTGIDNGVVSTGSATLLATQGAINTAITATTKAPGLQFLWETDTSDSDKGVGKVWANNSTLSSATVLYFDDVEKNGVSINALVDSLDDPTAPNSATIYIQEAGTSTAGVVFKVSGDVVSASTYSKVAVTHQATFGTLVDGDTIGVIFAFSGDAGTSVSSATTSTEGKVELATDAETITGTDTGRVVTPAGLQAKVASATAKGIAELATTAETVTGTDTGRVVTPAGLHGALAGLTDTTITASDTVIFADATDSAALKEDTVQGILDLVPDAAADAKGIVELATDAESVTGSDSGRATTPANITAKMAAPGAIGGTTAAAASFTTVSAAGNITLGDAATINMSTPLLAGADHTYTGLSAQMLAGGAISAFDLVCVHTVTQEVIEADASAYATARVIGIAPAAISDTATGTILLHGFIRDDTWSWTAGSTLYLSETAGAMTHTAPSTDGAFVQVIGVALSPDVVYMNPSMDVIEHA